MLQEMSIDSSSVQVSPSELVFNCSDGELLPSNTFGCQPIWWEMLQQTGEMSHQWSAFILPFATDSGVARVARVLLRSSADPEGRRAQAMDAFLLEHEGHERGVRATLGKSSFILCCGCTPTASAIINHQIGARSFATQFLHEFLWNSTRRTRARRGLPISGPSGHEFFQRGSSRCSTPVAGQLIGGGHHPPSRHGHGWLRSCAIR